MVFSCIKCLIAVPQESQQLSVLIVHLEHEGPLPRDASQVDATQGLEHPPGCGVLDRWSSLGWEGGLGVHEPLPEAICQGRLDQQAHGHDPQECHDPLGLFQRARGGQNAWIFEQPQAACHMVLPCIACQQFQGW
jgi:hypothetical protein